MATQYVGIDLHRRRWVIVGMTETGEVVEQVRIDNDPVALACEIEKPALTPRSSWRRVTAGTGPSTSSRPAAPGCTCPTR